MQCQRIACGTESSISSRAAESLPARHRKEIIPAPLSPRCVEPFQNGIVVLLRGLEALTEEGVFKKYFLVTQDKLALQKKEKSIHTSPTVLQKFSNETTAMFSLTL